MILFIRSESSLSWSDFNSLRAVSLKLNLIGDDGVITQWYNSTWLDDLIRTYATLSNVITIILPIFTSYWCKIWSPWKQLHLLSNKTFGLRQISYYIYSFAITYFISNLRTIYTFFLDIAIFYFQWDGTRYLQICFLSFHEIFVSSLKT